MKTDLNGSSPAEQQGKENDLVLVEDRGNYAILTINRPEKRNAMNRAARERFRSALVEVRGKKVVILTGKGTSFCAGVDLVEAGLEAAEAIRTSSQQLHDWSQCQADLRTHPAIFVAAVNGFALGGGSTLINNCELAVAGESATIGTPEIGFGIWPTQSGPAVIKRILPKHAAEILFTAQRIDAAKAFRFGLVNEVVPNERLLERASEIASHIAEFDSVTLDWGKKAYHHLQNLSWDDALDYSTYTSAIVSREQGVQASAGLDRFAAGHRGSGQGA